jgi:hypothetical protein
MRGRRFVSPVVACLALGSLAGTASGAEPAADPLAGREAQVRALFAADSTVPEGLFAPGFLAAVSAEQVAAITGKLFAQAGALEELRRISQEGPYTAKYEGRFAKGLVAPVNLTVEAAPPHRITGLWIGGFSKPVEAGTLADLPARFAELPGRATFAVCRLGDGPAKVVAGHEADRALAIGSSFKLWILGTLARDVAEGRHAWNEVAALASRDRSMPSGFLQTWPVGAPVTLHTLASLMISQSDNTATDGLLRVLGRERVEETMARMGAKAAAMNRPFLSTAEMFALKGVLPREKSAAFAAMEEKARRKFLAAELDPVDLASFRNWSAPYEVERVEWFASAADLCRALDWLRIAGETEAGKPALEILAINPGLPQGGKFAFHGFKGGSEPGVVAHAHLVRTQGGAWWAVAAAWNDGATAVDHARIDGLVEKALGLVAAEPAVVGKTE